VGLNLPVINFPYAVVKPEGSDAGRLQVIKRPRSRVIGVVPLARAELNPAIGIGIGGDNEERPYA
jgi:hypothetical protein